MRKIIVIVLLAWVAAAGCGKSKEEKLQDGVTYAKACLQGAGSNVLAAAGFQGYLRAGKTPVDYIISTLPKKDPPYDRFEYAKVSNPWTVVVRPGTDRGEFYIEGYGLDLKKPIYNERVEIKMPEE